MARSNPFFSVIIPALNEEPRLPRLLTSLQMQTIKNFEVIVVDAHSHDNTVMVAQEFKQSLPHLTIFSVKKRNPCYQRNLAAKKARGRYLVFCDADTTLPSSYLETMKKTIDTQGSLVLTSWVIGDNPSLLFKFFTSTANILVELLQYTPKQFACAAYMVVEQRLFLKVNGFREDLLTSDDHELAIRLRQAGGKITVVKNPRVTVSLRRFQSEGIFTVLYKLFVATFHMLFIGPITKKIFVYETGGQAHVHDN